VTTADDNIRQLFEPHAAADQERIAALATFTRGGVRTYAMDSPPLLPGAEGLSALLPGKVDYILIDQNEL